MNKVYVVMETVDGQQMPRVVYAEKGRAKCWIGGACVVEDKEPSMFTIDEVEGVGF